MKNNKNSELNISNNGTYTSKDVIMEDDFTINVPEGTYFIDKAFDKNVEEVLIINLPLSINTLSASTVKYCKNLKYFYYPGTTEEWENISRNPKWISRCNNPFFIKCNNGCIFFTKYKYTNLHSIIEENNIKRIVYKNY